MTTKKQELEALEKIREILKGLGPESYVAAAIDETVLTIAESNIENDFLESPTAKIEFSQRKESEAKADLENFRISADAKIDELTRAIDGFRTQSEQYLKCYNMQAEKNGELIDLKKELTAENDGLKNQVMILKAKLYDYMTA